MFFFGKRFGSMRSSIRGIKAVNGYYSYRIRSNRERHYITEDQGRIELKGEPYDYEHDPIYYVSRAVLVVIDRMKIARYLIFT